MEYWEFQKSQDKYKLNYYESLKIASRIHWIDMGTHEFRNFYGNGNSKKVNGQLTFDMVNGLFNY